MSLHYHIYECDSCHQRWPSFVTWGLFRYEITPEKFIHVDRTLGWCNDCDGFEPIEILPALVEDATESGKVEPVSSHNFRSSLIKRLPRWVASAIGAFGDRYASRAEGKALAERLALVDWRLGRVSPPRCLACGSTKIDSIQRVDQTEGNSAKTYVMNHPGCGGAIFAWLSEDRIALRTKIRIYTPEGELISIQNEA